MFYSQSVFTPPVPLLGVARAHEVTVHFAWHVQPIIALVAGLLILVMPRLLNFVVAAYLIIVGLIGIFGPRW